MIHLIETEERIAGYFSRHVDVLPSFDEDDDDQVTWPLSFLSKNDVEGTATLYERFNGTLVLRIDADVVTVTDSPGVSVTSACRT